MIILKYAYLAMKEKGGQIGCLKIENMHKVNMLKGCFFIHPIVYSV